MQVTYGKSFEVETPTSMIDKVKSLQIELSNLPQYEPKTKHYFHGGMYCREVFRHAGVLVVGAVHKKEHFYLIVSGTVAITTDDGVQEVIGPYLFSMTFHAIEEKSIEEIEAELVEVEDNSMYLSGNLVKQEVLEVLP